MKRTAARILVDQLQIHGVNHIFCVPGESYIAVLDALHDARDEIRFHPVISMHEVLDLALEPAAVIEASVSVAA